MTFKWSSIDFYGKTAYLLDIDNTNKLINQLSIKFKLNIDIGFKTPGYKYLKFIKNEDLSTLQSYPFLVTPSYGINPIWCLWLTTIDSTHYSLYVNLITKQIIWSKHRFIPELYHDTLFEGEIINQQFIIWDILLKNGQSTQNLNLHQRIDIIRGIILYDYISDPIIENISLILKPYFDFKFVKSFINQPSSIPIKGLMFIQIDRSMRYLTVLFNNKTYLDDFNLGNLDPSDLNPLTPLLEDIMIYPEKHISPENNDNTENDCIQEFWLSPADKSYNYYQYYFRKNDQELVRVGLVIIRTLNLSFKINQIFQNNKGINKLGVKNLLKFKCIYLKKFKKWEPIDLIY